MSPENNLHNKEAMLRKMYKSSELLKYVLGKMPNCFIYLSNKKSSYSHFYLSIPPKIPQVLTSLTFLRYRSWSLRLFTPV